MTSTERLHSYYGIETTWENGTAYFSGAGKYVIRNINGQPQYIDEVLMLMEDVEEHEQPQEGSAANGW